MTTLSFSGGFAGLLVFGFPFAATCSLIFRARSSDESVAVTTTTDMYASWPYSPRYEQDHPWTYAGLDSWTEEYPACAGAAQSPVNLVTKGLLTVDSNRVSLWDRFESIPAGDCRVRNGGPFLKVFGEFGALSLDDGRYEVFMIRFHFPSEHTIDGRAAAGEMQIILHREGAEEKDGLAMVSVLLEVMPDNAVDEQAATEIDFFGILGFNESLPAEGEHRPVAGEIDLSVFAPSLSGDFLHYQGSLTMPPCCEGIHWYVLERPAAVTSTMVDLYNAQFARSGRPVQAMNGRAIVRGSLDSPGELWEEIGSQCKYDH